MLLQIPPQRDKMTDLELVVQALLDNKVKFNEFVYLTPNKAISRYKWFESDIFLGIVRGRLVDNKIEVYLEQPIYSDKPAFN